MCLVSNYFCVKYENIRANENDIYKLQFELYEKRFNF